MTTRTEDADASQTRSYTVYVHQTRVYAITIEAASEEDAIAEAEELFDYDNTGFRLRELEIDGWEAEPAEA